MPNEVDRFETLETIEVHPMSDDPDEFVAQLPYSEATRQRRLQVRLDHLPLDTPLVEGHTRFVCISDTHGYHREMEHDPPPGDVLLHSGDFTAFGKPEEVEDFNDWLGTLPHKHKILIAGNHELTFDSSLVERVHQCVKDGVFTRFEFITKLPSDELKKLPEKLTNCIFLHDQEVTINGIRIYGTPWNPHYGGWAFNLERGQPLLDKWNKIPTGIDILMTHCPPAGQLDAVSRFDRAGCVELMNTVQLRVKPKFHVFGHIHEGYGYNTDGWHRFINSSILHGKYRVPCNKPIIFDLPTPADAVEGCSEVVQH